MNPSIEGAITIALDAMSGDRGPGVVIPAAIRALKTYPQLRLILVGDEPFLKKKWGRRLRSFQARLSIQHASQVVAMDELPSQALRYKKDSSLRVALNLVKTGDASACVSAGNTGALVATAHFVLKMLQGVDRPAIIGMIPSSHSQGYIRMLDLGANIDTNHRHLFQFAVMASMMVEAIEGKRPRVALLNIGEEEIKGNEAIKEAARYLRKCSVLNYVGFVEGHTIFADVADIVVCDGFAGNVALKTSEGLARFIRAVMTDAFNKNLFTRLGAFLIWPILRGLRNKLNPERYNGASLIGLQGTVIKSHGNTTPKGFFRAIERAMIEARVNVPLCLGDKIGDLLAQYED